MQTLHPGGREGAPVCRCAPCPATPSRSSWSGKEGGRSLSLGEPDNPDSGSDQGQHGHSGAVSTAGALDRMSREGASPLGSSSWNTQARCGHQKNIREIVQTMQLPQNCQVHQKWGMSEKGPQPTGASSRSRGRAVGKKLGRSIQGQGCMNFLAHMVLSPRLTSF